MLWVHPFLQICATIIGLYAGYHGVKRLLSQHAGLKIPFNWKQHVTIGRIAIGLWMLGMAGGLTVARLKWEVNFVTGAHYKIAFTMLPLMIFGAVSGYYMDKNKAKRTLLPLAHGVCNLLLVGLALYQIRTGWQVIKDFIL
ncbi:conserved membrane protein of unknown function [Pseudodesulfovibrio profundus]|uniref:DUF4079 family protein n=1 Tax=Pseudodesulfovibrio profundus TaxID=57320 RepID=A0A2C8FA77_9BACT|nr:DUF4079 family protein [Pseudodesulfovibrio profundus]SOB59334.1 conserved membrane protein of unknown function [Pseudodesulfovibrio profundus]